MKIGIDRVGFATTSLFLDLKDLAVARGVDPNKYLIGIGQSEQAVIPPTQDIVTLATQAAAKFPKAELAQVSTLIVATESGIDNSKASAVYVKHLLGLDDFVRTVELKEACYSATAGLQFAKGLIVLNPNERILVIGSDIARYGLETGGEVTQGGGAVAMMVTANPRVMVFGDTNVAMTKDIMDFWRPLYRTEALVDGKFSTQVYIDFFQACWQRYRQLTGRTLADFEGFLFHLPFTKMGRKALASELGDREDEVASRYWNILAASQIYSRRVGNLYTGSLYLGLLSALNNGQLEAGNQLGLFSYGSGAEGEFYTGTLVAGFENFIDHPDKFLDQRRQVSVAEYEQLFNQQLGMKSEDITFDVSNDPAEFVLAGQTDHKRVYQRK
ncbi:hydroxymethylglutaryl-CoA synthase [Lactobacillus alvi]|uniref:Hydroxymethylglutaryl-CoA synthase n=1 Tax=Limosilactobacillus alvi TaxID=990412 RepID=A0ABS2EN83_9LACO|nr:hydroxymethylglutaryl-CoA synthase [Limosilactobacillus alvi]MBM6753957.1 hydroxymethylglutaryl-CoA synthase [Limosilactobacillus alvi]